MPEPLDYRNPHHRDGEVVRPPAEVNVPLAIPAEFDLCVARTEDHAAARAIEVALLAAQIELFRGSDHERANRLVMLHVRKADEARAMEIAGTIFARRAKFRAHPKTRPVDLPETTRLGPFWP